MDMGNWNWVQILLGLGDRFPAWLFSRQEKKVILVKILNVCDRGL